MNYLFWKRVFDVVAATGALLVLSPVFLVTAVLIKLDSRGPVFFHQERLGRGGEPFKVHKFRSMYLGAEKLGVYEMKDDPRVTRVGRVLRRLSINELPQFFNILKGEMSLIGPRPVMPHQPWDWSKATPAQRHRFGVKPGLTGWAQVHGRMNVPWDRRVEYDAEYVDRISPSLDLKIILRTIVVVLSMKDSYNKFETAPPASKRSTDDPDH